MSLYSGIIKEQSEVINRLEDLTSRYHALTKELIDVLAQHINVSDYEKRLAEISRKEEAHERPYNADTPRSR